MLHSAYDIVLQPSASSWRHPIHARLIDELSRSQNCSVRYTTTVLTRSGLPLLSVPVVGCNSYNSITSSVDARPVDSRALLTIVSSQSEDGLDEVVGIMLGTRLTCLQAQSCRCRDLVPSGMKGRLTQGVFDMGTKTAISARRLFSISVKRSREIQGLSWTLDCCTYTFSVGVSRWSSSTVSSTHLAEVGP